MAEKIKLKVMKCPTCGGDLKAENDGKEIVCVYCGNVIVPVTESNSTPQKEGVSGFGTSVRIEGIKTPSSALAYMDQFFEEYDWEAFSYAGALSIPETDKLADSLMVTSADDKKTWFVCFKAVYVPFMRKVESCKHILDAVIEGYKNGDLDAYSKFDAYKRISDILSSGKDKAAAKLEKNLANANKYGASADESAELASDIENIKNQSLPDIYDDIESIPEIKDFINEKNRYIAKTLAAKGIDADKEYDRAKSLIKEKKYVEALNLLRSLQGYSDSHDLIEKLDKYFLISDVLEIGGKLYFFKKADSDSTSLDLYPADGSMISNKPIIEHLSQVITNYADILYYLGGNHKLYKYDFSANVRTMIFDEPLSTKTIHVYGRRAFLISANTEEYGQETKIIELDTPTGTVKTLLDDVSKILSFSGSKIVYTVTESEYDKFEKTDGKKEYITCILDVNTMRSVELGKNEITVEGYINNCVVYTRTAPNEYNRDLYIKSLVSIEPEKLIEPNIFRFCDIIENKLFYYIGNSHNETLINIDPDGTQRREWGLYTNRLLFSQGGWIYFIRRAGYNSILCKSKLDGDKFTIIAADIDEFIEIKNGYLYYINGDSDLMKVRMDGSNLQKLCDDVESVLSVKENKIVFISADDTIVRGEAEERRSTRVKSIYAVDFTGSGKIKLAYNIKDAKEYDEDTVYYIATEKTKGSYDEEAVSKDVLYSLDAKTNSTKKLLDIKIRDRASGCSGFAIAMLIAAMSFILSLVGFGAESAGLGIFGMIACVISLIAGFMTKIGKDSLG